MRDPGSDGLRMGLTCITGCDDATVVNRSRLISEKFELIHNLYSDGMKGKSSKGPALPLIFSPSSTCGLGSDDEDIRPRGPNGVSCKSVDQQAVFLPEVVVEGGS